MKKYIFSILILSVTLISRIMKKHRLQQNFMHRETVMSTAMKSSFQKNNLKLSDWLYKV